LIFKNENFFGIKISGNGKKTVLSGNNLSVITDKQTQELIVNSYRRMKNGEGKSEALRNTMLSIIKEIREKSGSAHLFFWASFIFAGEP